MKRTAIDDQIAFAGTGADVPIHLLEKKNASTSITYCRKAHSFALGDTDSRVDSIRGSTPKGLPDGSTFLSTAVGAIAQLNGEQFFPLLEQLEGERQAGKHQ